VAPGRLLAALLAFGLVGGAAGFGGCSPILRLGDIEPPPGKRIVASVGYSGNKALADGDISEKIFHRPESLNPSDDKVFLNEYELGLDRKRIESLYAANGYFDARVSPAKVSLPNKYIAQLEFGIEEGEPTKVLGLQLNSPAIQAARPSDNGITAETQYWVKRNWKRLIPLKRGDVWTETAHRKSKELLTRALHDRGFAFAQVFGDVLVHKERHVASVTYHVIVGPLVRVGEVKVRGNKVAPTQRILTRVELKKGDIVTPTKLADAERRVLGMGAFAGVRITIEHEPLAKKLGKKPPTYENLRALAWPSSVPLSVVVNETTFNEVQAGGGISADSSEVGIFARVGYTNRDFLGELGDETFRLRTFRFEAQPSVGIVLDENVVRAAPGVESTLQFIQPAIITEYTQLSARADYEYSTSELYDSHFLRGSVSLSNTVIHELTIRGGFSAEYWHLGLSDQCSNCDDLVSLGFDALQGLELDPDKPDIVLTSFNLGITLDLRDSIADPRNGFYAAASADFAVYQFEFIKLVGDIRGYYTFSHRSRDYVTLAARLRLGAIWLLGDTTALPLPARFRGGGANDMRGYSLDQMGPFLCQNSTSKALTAADETTGNCGSSLQLFPLGGGMSAVASIEARFYLWESIALVAFFDVGQIWGERNDFNFSELDLAPGGGLRIYTPIGAIRLDVAGLLRNGAVTTHISLGQSY